jgi:GntR family transcriptional regulator
MVKFFPNNLFIQVTRHEEKMADSLLNPRRINKDLPVPYYYQIVQVLRESIADIDKKEDHVEIPLPSEAELCDMFAVNRGTIRHALDMLEREGLIYREKGRGTFVRRRRVELDLSYLCSTTDDLRNRGWEPATEVISINQVTPRSHICASLNLDENEKVWEVYRRRLANGEPISLQRAFFAVSLMPDLVKKDLTGSFFTLWKELYQIQPSYGEQTIRTRVATSEEAELLLISECDPIFEITRVTFDINSSPFEYLISVWRGDRYDFNVRLSSR